MNILSAIILVTLITITTAMTVTVTITNAAPAPHPLCPEKLNAKLPGEFAVCAQKKKTASKGCGVRRNQTQNFQKCWQYTFQSAKPKHVRQMFGFRGTKNLMPPLLQNKHIL